MLVAPHRRRFFNAAAESGDPYWANVSLLLHCDGADASTTFTDSSSYAHTATAAGNAQIDTAQSKFGGASGLFDGTGDKLSVADHASLQFGTGDLTVEFWLRMSSVATSDGVIGKIADGASMSAGRWRFYFSTTLKQMYWQNNAGGAGTSTNSITVSTWHHVAAARASGVTKLFIDGVEEASFADTQDYNTTDSMYIADSGNVADLHGWIDDLRITKGVARYTANFTPPTAAFPDS